MTDQRELTLTRTFEQHQCRSVVSLEIVQRRDDAARHLQRQRIDCFWSIEADNAREFIARDDQIAMFERRLRHRALSINLRDTISRMISLVPSRI